MAEDSFISKRISYKALLMSKHSTFQIGFIVKKKKDKKEDNNNLQFAFTISGAALVRRVKPTCFSSKLLKVPLLEKVGSCRDQEKFGGQRWSSCHDQICPSLIWKKILLSPPQGWSWRWELSLASSPLT